MPRGKKNARRQSDRDGESGKLIPAEVLPILFSPRYFNYDEMSRARGISQQVKNFVEHLLLSKIQSVTKQVEVMKREMAESESASRGNKLPSGSKRKLPSPQIVPLHREVSELEEILAVFWLYKQEQTDRRMGLYWGRFVDVCSDCVELIQSTVATPDTPYRNIDSIKQLTGDLFGLLQRDTSTIGNELRGSGGDGEGQGSSSSKGRRSRPKRTKSNFVLNNLFMQLVHKHMSEGTLEEFRKGVARDSHGKRCSYGNFLVSSFESPNLTIVDMDGSVTKKIGG